MKARSKLKVHIKVSRVMVPEFEITSCSIKNRRFNTIDRFFWRMQRCPVCKRYCLHTVEEKKELIRLVNKDW